MSFSAEQLLSSGTLFEVGRMLRPEWSQDQIKEILETGFDILMSDLFETSYEKAVQFTQHLDVKLLAVKIKPNKPKIGILLYDGRYADNVTDKAPLCYLLVSANGREARRVSQIHDLPVWLEALTTAGLATNLLENF